MTRKQKSLIDFFSSPIKRAKNKTVINSDGYEKESLSSLTSETDVLFTSSLPSQEKIGSRKVTKKNTDEARYTFLADVMDKNGRCPEEQGYDKSTLYISDEELNALTPFEKQFWSIKKEHFDTIVCFKKGKFYELYENDAEVGSKLFDMKITERVNMKMAGFPVNCFDLWAGRFLEKGYRIARVDQKENMISKRMREKKEKENYGKQRKQANIIERELKEIITEGTIYNYNHIKTTLPIYTSAIKYNEDISVSILLYDACINEILVKTVYEKLESFVQTVFVQYNIKETICERKIEGVKTLYPIKGGSAIDFQSKFENTYEYTCFLYLDNYMSFLKRDDFKNNIVIHRLSEKRNYLVIDNVSLKNLNIIDDSTSLFNAINYCSTPSGQRLLRKWLLYPLTDREKILERQIVVSELVNLELSDIKRNIAKIGDLDRFIGRLNNSSYTVKDLFILKTNLSLACDFISVFLDRIANADKLCDKFGVYRNVMRDLSRTISMFSQKYSVSEHEIELVDNNQDDEYFLYTKELKKIEQRLKAYLEEQKARLNCKILCFKDLGKEIFQIEVPINVSVPAGYFLTSSTKTTKRYYTHDLKMMVSEYNECAEKIFQAKGSILGKATRTFLQSYLLFYKTSNLLSEIDCFLSFATFAQIHIDATYPKFADAFVFENLRNPIFPNYVGNSFEFNKDNVLLLTGPNMAGKSTFLRTICLNVILGQMGMKVLATKMEIRLFDRIFTRIGASDNLLRGESTFFVEMKETSTILNECNENSLVIIDELGRGTSTRDGESIARATIEYLNQKKIYSLFSTHYHKIVEKIQNVRKGFMGTMVDDGEIIFLFKLHEGVCHNSQGITVAKLAGVPQVIIDRATKIRQIILQQNLQG